MTWQPSANERIYWATADQFAQELVEHLRTVPTIEQIALAGSYRRGRETVGDLDILAVAHDAAAAMDRLAEFDGVEVVARGGTKMTVRLRKRTASRSARGAGRVVRRGTAIFHRLEGT